MLIFVELLFYESLDGFSNSSEKKEMIKGTSCSSGEAIFRSAPGSRGVRTGDLVVSLNRRENL